MSRIWVRVFFFFLDKVGFKYIWVCWEGGGLGWDFGGEFLLVGLGWVLFIYFYLYFFLEEEEEEGFWDFRGGILRVLFF